MKIGILCSHPFAFPAIQSVASSGNLCGLGCPEKDGLTSIVRNLADQAFVPMTVIEGNIETSLKAWLDTVRPDTVFVLGFPYKIPAPLLSETAFYNFHTGLLPEYGGIDPVFWQIKNGETHDGISVHLMDAGFDSGPIALLRKIEFLPYETYGLHLERLAFLAQEAAIELTEKLTNNTLELQEQSVQEQAHLLRPAFDDLLIHWNSQSAEAIRALVQASNPAYGGAGTFLKGRYLRILQVGLPQGDIPGETQPGTILSIENGLFVRCLDGKVLKIEIVYCDAGLFTGETLARAFALQPGDCFAEK